MTATHLGSRRWRDGRFRLGGGASRSSRTDLADTAPRPESQLVSRSAHCRATAFARRPGKSRCRLIEKMLPLQHDCMDGLRPARDLNKPSPDA